MNKPRDTRDAFDRLLEGPSKHWCLAWNDAVAACQGHGDELHGVAGLQALAEEARFAPTVPGRLAGIKTCLRALAAALPHLLDEDLRALIESGKRRGRYAQNH